MTVAERCAGDGIPSRACGWPSAKCPLRGQTRSQRDHVHLIASSKKLVRLRGRRRGRAAGGAPTGRISIFCNRFLVSLTPGFSRVLVAGRQQNGFNRFPCRRREVPGQAVETALATSVRSPPG